MNGCSDFVVLCGGDTCMSWIVASIIGVTIIVSILIVVSFLVWKIVREKKFDQEIFENFRKSPSANGNVQNPDRTNGK